MTLPQGALEPAETSDAAARSPWSRLRDRPRVGVPVSGAVHAAPRTSHQGMHCLDPPPTGLHILARSTPGSSTAFREAGRGAPSRDCATPPRVTPHQVEIPSHDAGNPRCDRARRCAGVARCSRHDPGRVDIAPVGAWRRGGRLQGAPAPGSYRRTVRIRPVLRVHAGCLYWQRLRAEPRAILRAPRVGWRGVWRECRRRRTLARAASGSRHDLVARAS